MNTEQILPTNDVMFKMIFGDQRHPRVLIHFLNSVIQPKSPIVSVKINQSELTPETVSQKGVRLDILATTDDGTIINVEMQKNSDKHMVARSLFYWSKVFSGQLEVKEEYKNLNRTISINILDFRLFEKDERFWRKCAITDLKTNEQLTDLLELHFIELDKLKTMRNDSPITFWVEFFKDPYSEKVRALCDFVPEIKEAKEIYEKAKVDPEAQELMRIREKAVRDYSSDIGAAREEGIEIGREEGIEIGSRLGEKRGIESERKKNALNMKADGLPNEVIAKYLGISLEEAERLLSEK